MSKLVLTLVLAIVSALFFSGGETTTADVTSAAERLDPVDDGGGLAGSALVEDDDDGGETSDDVEAMSIASPPLRSFETSHGTVDDLLRTDRTYAPETPPPRG